MVKRLRSRLLLLIVSLFILVLVIPLPKDKLKYSKALYSKENVLLSARVSDDGQWCMPVGEFLPDQVISCILEYEDAWFYYHPGVNPVSMFKALTTYIRTGKIKRGGSTLPMQVMRMRFKNRDRNIRNKILESVCAVKYSLTRRKSTVLKEWAQMAPFGGNTIGIRSASLRYFGRELSALSWGECALLAVMPNSPSSANLAVNRKKLKQKRDLLLQKLASKGYFPKNDLDMYRGEELPDHIRKMPDEAPFLLDFLSKKYPSQSLFISTVAESFQKNLTENVEKETGFLVKDDIRNAAAIIMDIRQNELLAYTGNVREAEGGSRNFVDAAQAPRSYGSLLKPFLYAYALEEGFILPGEIIFDIPTVIGDFRPKNFDETFRGIARADEVILSSLNVPSVRLLNQVGLSGFYHMLQKLRPRYLDKGENHYGLSLILGGGETTLWEMSRLYKGLARNYGGFTSPFEEVKLLTEEKSASHLISFQFSSSTIASVVHTMADISRPREERFWFAFDPNQKIAWKTGTSYGHRDAWCVGFNGKYLVAVWIGNENGEGRFGLTGINKAAPLLFQIFRSLPDNRWFDKLPDKTVTKTITVCKESGRIAGTLCKHTTRMKVDRESFRWQTCRFHTAVWLNKEGLWSERPCAPDGRTDTVFALPPEVEYYYKASDMFYKGLPRRDPACVPATTPLSIIYPEEGVKIFIPAGENGENGAIIAKAHHPAKDAELFWFMDDNVLPAVDGQQRSETRILKPKAGKHQLTVVDSRGNRHSVRFEVIQ